VAAAATVAATSTGPPAPVVAPPQLPDGFWTPPVAAPALGLPGTAGLAAVESTEANDGTAAQKERAGEKGGREPLSNEDDSGEASLAGDPAAAALGEGGGVGGGEAEAEATVRA